MRIMLNDMSHRFPGQVPLFEHLTFTFEPGVLTGVVGPSGSGKSTLLSLMSGSLMPTSGQILGQEGLRVGWIPQQPVGPARRTLVDQVALPLLAQGWELRRAVSRAHELLAQFGLAEAAHRQFRHCSGGEAQRFAFARATAARYDVLLLDEPTAQLDPTTATTVRSVVHSLVGEERIVAVATHDEQLRNTCDCLLDLGRPR